MDPVLNKGCAVCGRTPTRRLVIRRHVGKVFRRSVFRLERSLCREHGVEITKSYLGKTMVQGWWGIISFFANIAIIVADVCVLITYKRVPEPLEFGQSAPRQNSPAMPAIRRFDGSALPTPF